MCHTVYITSVFLKKQISFHIDFFFYPQGLSCHLTLLTEFEQSHKDDKINCYFLLNLLEHKGSF